MGAALSSSCKPGKDQVVLITGCSSGGLGHALALAFSRAGCHVIATARTLESMSGLEAAAADFDPNESGDAISPPKKMTLLTLDVNSEASREAAVAEALRLHGRIDILVNNAGMLCIGPIAELPPYLIQQTFSTNVFCKTNLCDVLSVSLISCLSYMYNSMFLCVWPCICGLYSCICICVCFYVYGNVYVVCIYVYAYVCVCVFMCMIMYMWCVFMCMIMYM